MKKKQPQFDRHMGLRIKTARRTANVSQTALGEALGVSFQQVQKYENGTNRVSCSTVFAIAQRLGYPVAFFFDAAETHRGGPDLSGLTGAITAIKDKRKRDLVVQMAQTMARVAGSA